MHWSAVACGLWSRAKSENPGFEPSVAYGLALGVRLGGLEASLMHGLADGEERRAMVDATHPIERRRDLTWLGLGLGLGLGLAPVHLSRPAEVSLVARRRA